MPTQTIEETRKQILETAKVLLRKHGYDKMTVVDIGRSLGMSHANVYRFFENKSDILDAICDEWISKLEDFVEEIAQRAEPASARIEAVVVELHKKRKQKWLKDAEVFETYRRVLELKPDLAAQRREKIVNVFERLINEGINNGEFSNVNSHEAAIALKDAATLFLHPFLISTMLKEATEARARRVVGFVLAGMQKDRKRILKKRRQRPTATVLAAASSLRVEGIAKRR